jgi:hypothetical protein
MSTYILQEKIFDELGNAGADRCRGSAALVGCRAPLVVKRLSAVLKDSEGIEKIGML